MTGSTRSRLERAALELFERDGYDVVTTAQIADAAGVTQRTFFRHFPTKLDVLLGDVSARTTEFVSLLHRQPVTRELVDALVNVIAATSGPGRGSELDLARGRVLLGTASLAGVTRTYEVELERLLAEWIAARTSRDPADFDVRTIAAMFVAARRVVVSEWVGHGGTSDIAELARRSLTRLDTTR